MEEKLIEECLLYVSKIAESKSDHESLISLGNEVLLDCLIKFNPELSNNFVLFFKKEFKYRIKDYTIKQNKNTTFNIDEECISHDKVKEFFSKKEISFIVRQALNKLDDKEKCVLLMMYHDNLKQKEVAMLMDNTEARISQINKNALKKMSEDEIFKKYGVDEWI